jgi:tetratricopeptide (TPR) repeat protein
MLEDISGEQIKEQFKSNKKLRLITMVVGGLVVIVLGFFAYRQFMWKPENEKSKDSYWRGMNHAKVDSTDLAINELSAATKKYDGKIGGENAQFAYARQLMVKGNFKKALTELEGVEVTDTYISILCIGLQADCHSELGDYEKAANMYLSAADVSSNDWTTPMYLMKAGLCAEEIKNFEKATECYQRIKDDYTSYAQQRKIDKYIARAESQQTGK